MSETESFVTGQSFYFGFFNNTIIENSFKHVSIMVNIFIEITETFFYSDQTKHLFIVVE